MEASIVDLRTAGIERDAFDAVLPYLDAAEQKLRDAQAALGYTDAIMDAASDALALLPGSLDEWLLRDGSEGEAARRLHRLRQRRKELPGSTAAATFLTVRELAASIGVSDATARNYLERGLIPGARKADPSKSKSRWIIPADAPTRYMKEADDAPRRP